MHHDDTPEADAQLAFLLGENALLGRIVVETKLNSEAHKTAHEAPESASLSLGVESASLVLAK